MRLLAFRAIVILRGNELIEIKSRGQAMHNSLTSRSVAIALTAGAAYHFAVLVALAAILA
jgi:hypothetical protein